MNLKEIKDAARQAFRDQQTQDTEGGVPDAVSFIAGFLAGARHLQDAYETLNAHDEMLIATVDKLKEENKKLVEALKFYADKNSWIYDKNTGIGGLIIANDEWDDTPSAGAATFYPSYGGKRARQVLKEIGEE
jgi:hypothetical protein